MISPLDTLNAAAAQLAGDEPLADAGEQIMALQAQIEALRERQAEQDSKKPFTPHAAPGSGKGYIKVAAGESLHGIADRLGLANAYQDLFQPNMSAIEEAARNAGYPGGSDQGSILPDGTWLEVPAWTVATKPE